MKRIDIDFRHFSSDFDRKDNIFTNLLRRRYEVNLTQNNPGHVFFSNFYGGDTLTMPEIEGNFVKIFYTGENCRPRMDKCDWAFSFDYDEEMKNPRHLRLPLYVFYGHAPKLIKKNFNKSKLRQIKNQKKKFCNYLYSKDAKERVDFFKKLSKYKHIDAPGKSMNNMRPIISNPLISAVGGLERKITGKNKMAALFARHFEDFQKTKIRFLKDYKFTIAFENSSYPGYTTEKITHPMLANSIPIYWGNPLISRDFNTKSFINYHEYNDTNKLVDRVIEIDSEEKKYLNMLKEPFFKGNKISKYGNEKKILRRLEEIFG